MTTHPNQSTLPCIEINPPFKAKGCVIWLHGLGADGNDFAPIVPQLNLPLRFVFPHAPMRPVTVNQGAIMRAWFDITSLRFDEEVDQRGIEASVKLIEALIEKEKQAGTSAEKIILAGFSQGAIIALMNALHYPERLGGVLALSGCLPFEEQLMQKTTIANQTIPIFLAHGTEDALVPYALGAATYEMLKKYNPAVEWHSYPMGHGVCEEEIRDIVKWIKQLF